MKSEAAAEVARLAAEKEAKQRALEAKIAIELSKKREKEEFEEKRRLEKLAYEKAKKEK